MRRRGREEEEAEEEELEERMMWRGKQNRMTMMIGGGVRVNQLGTDDVDGVPRLKGQWVAHFSDKCIGRK